MSQVGAPPEPTWLPSRANQAASAAAAASGQNANESQLHSKCCRCRSCYSLWSLWLHQCLSLCLGFCLSPSLIPLSLSASASAAAVANVLRVTLTNLIDDFHCQSSSSMSLSLLLSSLAKGVIVVVAQSPLAPSPALLPPVVVFITLSESHKLQLQRVV